MPSANELKLKGLNLQSVIPLKDLSDEVLGSFSRFQAGTKYSHVLLVGHAGNLFWSQFVAAKGSPEGYSGNPIDDYSSGLVKQFLESQYPDAKYRFLYPGDEFIDLEAIGKHCGWHHASPLWIGINGDWGTWFAYRTLVLIDRAIAVSDDLAKRLQSLASPCGSCADKPCIGHCPAGAASSSGFNIGKCSNYRVSAGSACGNQCVARLSCPVASEHRYVQEQVEYHYGHSLQTIRDYFKGT